MLSKYWWSKLAMRSLAFSTLSNFRAISGGSEIKRLWYFSSAGLGLRPCPLFGPPLAITPSFLVKTFQHFPEIAGFLARPARLYLLVPATPSPPISVTIINDTLNALAFTKRLGLIVSRIIKVPHRFFSGFSALEKIRGAIKGPKGSTVRVNQVVSVFRDLFEGVGYHSWFLS